MIDIASIIVSVVGKKATDLFLKLFDIERIQLQKAYQTAFENTIEWYEKEYGNIYGEKHNRFFDYQIAEQELAKLLLIKPEPDIALISQIQLEEGTKVPKKVVQEFVQKLREHMSLLREFDELHLKRESLKALTGISDGTTGVLDDIETGLREIRDKLKYIDSKEINKLKETSDPQSIWIVHGRNLKARTAMFRFLRAIGLKPIEWSEAISFTNKPAPFIGEILERAFLTAQAVIVILTGDDIAYLRKIYHNDDDPDYEKNPTPQARPNVIFEAGLAFGYKPEKTVLVQIGKTRPFSDIAGIHILNMDNSPQKRHELVSRLESTGCKICDLKNKMDWLSEGDFEKCLIDSNDLKDNTNFSKHKLHKLDKLKDIEIEILKSIANAENQGKSEVEIDFLCEDIEIPRLKMKYHLENLKYSDYINIVESPYDGIFYFLTDKGRSQLIENNLV